MLPDCNLRFLLRITLTLTKITLGLYLGILYLRDTLYNY